jgi:hypothetical protein
VRALRVETSSRRLPAACIAATVVAGLLPVGARCQITPAQASQLRDAIGNRIEALTILGGDYGIAAANFRSTGKFTFGESTDTTLTVTKLGGAGDVGDPQPLGSLPVGWQPRVQGNMGWLDGTQHLHSDLLELEGDITRIRTYGIEFGGGARFWVNDRVSFTPTLMGLYGHTSETYTANSAFARANLEAARELGLIDWNVDTWTLITGVDFQYLLRLQRTIITLSSHPVSYHTESFQSSNVHLDVHGDSRTWANTIDVDIPLRVELFGHELRSGGYYRWTGFYGGLRDGLGQSDLNEIHGRVVLDFLNQLWKVQWIGIGASYLWGPNISGWSAGLDVVFRF